MSLAPKGCNMAPTGLEPVTCGFTDRCSTIELRRLLRWPHHKPLLISLSSITSQVARSEK
jgi:hypothetical protein